jgi:predicted GNAT family acetyltransferase
MEIEHDAARQRYLLRMDGQIASALDYTVNDGIVSMTRTFTNPPFRRRGLAAMLVERAVNDAAGQGKRVAPMCWYVAEWFDAHPERTDLLA